MEIPNYDSSDEEGENGYKQLFDFMPSSNFRMLICGPSGSGKTDLLAHISRVPLIYFDKVWLHSKNLEQKNYKKLKKCLMK